MSGFVVPEWMETAADREERLERERLAEQRLIQAQRQAHLEAIRLCSELVRVLPPNHPPPHRLRPRPRRCTIFPLLNTVRRARALFGSPAE